MNVTSGNVPDQGRVVLLCGGVGGAKLALGLSRAVGDRLTVIVNTGDDFQHLGLEISPDLDTVLYTLSGLANQELGWGRHDETWNFMDALRQYGSETWFQLGDRDLALHVERTRYLAKGGSLTAFTNRLATGLGIPAKILPMSDQPVRTIIHSPEGSLGFQRYFVEHRCAPVVKEIEFAGACDARPTKEVIDCLTDPLLAAVIIAPSNPFLSIDPILSIAGIRSRLEGLQPPVVAVSPLIGGKAVKGPTDKIMIELGVKTSPAAIASHYAGMIHGLVIDHSDEPYAEKLLMPYRVTSTLMKSQDDRERLANEVLEFAASIAQSTGDGG